ncbi:hypothetical protein A2U01_0085513, partial [Trifolium medium]|nr:hypothetical protein [Trifolium medium]
FVQNSLKWAFSLSSWMRSKLSYNAALLSGHVAVSLLQLGGSISTRIMASTPYTNVKGGSPVEDCVVV